VATFVKVPQYEPDGGVAVGSLPKALTNKRDKKNHETKWRRK